MRAGSYIVEAEAGGSVAGSRAFIGAETTALSISIKPKAHPVELAGFDPDLGVERGVIEGARAVLRMFNGVELEEPLQFTLPVKAILPQGVYTLEVSAEGYPVSTVEITVESPGAVYVPIEPLKVDVAFTVSADVSGEAVPVLWGTLILDHTEIEEEKPFEVEITQGSGEARLRPGLYRAEYRVEVGGVEVSVDAGNILVPEEGGGVEVVIKPPLAAVKVAALDSEFSVRLPEFSVSYTYLGPFGQLEGVVEGAKGEAVLQLPPGRASLEVGALGFRPASLSLEIAGDVELEVEMEPIVFGIAVSLADPDGNPVEEEVELVLKHTTLPLELRARGEGPILRLEGVRPGNYIAEVNVVSEESLLADTQLRITVTQEGAVVPGVLTVEYKRLTVELWLLDALTGEPIGFPYIVELERQAPEGGLSYSVETVVRGKAVLSLPPGTYKASLSPEAGQSYYRVDTAFSFTVLKPGKVELRISPIMYTVTVLVVDDRGSPQQGALVRVLSEEGVEVASGLTDGSGSFTFQAPYGIYIVNAEKPGYRESTGTIQVPQSTTLTITLNPGPLVLLQRYGPIAVGFIGLAALAAGIYRIRERIARRLLEEEEYF
ncbi:carboxypeptidase regulatory-like domain-containing protein [Aeropyrum camini]|uniref:carboxypeptidase regulatory-like domain-containing protein n=1 Tax=Aeropyrum camini TaxID=229980 RepID=UPI000788FE83|nr:carboxypeptidase regulatory-like domain-containing protein [Aeropyrum camini]